MKKNSTLAIDLGKTWCRARVGVGADRQDRRVEGAPGLASASEVRDSLHSVRAVLDDLDVEAVDRVVIGAAGYESSTSGLRHEFTSGLQRLLPNARVTATSDLLIAHAGAFGGRSGTLLVASTGAVALRCGAGVYRRADGWGPWLGDRGSAFWIGLEGLRAAAAHADGAGPAAAISAHLPLAGELRGLARWVVETPHIGRRVADCARGVLAAAEHGDDVAVRILRAAVQHLAVTTLTARDGHGDVIAVGGVASVPMLRDALAAELRAAGVTLGSPAGDALDGAMLLLASDSALYEGHVHHV